MARVFPFIIHCNVYRIKSNLSYRSLLNLYLKDTRK